MDTIILGVIIDPERDVFPVRGTVDLLVESIETVPAQGLGTAADRPTTGKDISSKIHAGTPGPDDLSYYCRVDERAVGRYPHSDIKPEVMCRLGAAAEHIGPTSAEKLHLGEAFDVFRNRIIDRARRSRHDDPVQLLNSSDPRQDAVEDRATTEVGQDLAGNPAGVEPGEDECTDGHLTCR